MNRQNCSASITKNSVDNTFLVYELKKIFLKIFFSDSFLETELAFTNLNIY